MKKTENSIYPDFFKSGVGKLQQGTLGTDDLITLFTAMENYQRDIKEVDNAADILRITHGYVAGLDLFQGIAFYLVDHASQGFTLALCQPDAKKDQIETLVHTEIDSGKFAWALRQRVTVFLSALRSRKANSAVFHSLRSSKQTVGMFCGLLKGQRTTSQEISFSLLSILLGISADALTGVRNTDDLRHKIDVAGRELRLSMEHANELARQAQAANEAKSQFLASMSHEIRTPMNAIIGVAGMLLDADLPTPQRQQVETVRSAGESLLYLINDILDFSKIEAGKIELEIINFELRHTITGAVELLRIKAREKKLRLEYSVSPEVPERLMGDPARLGQILINLAGNAIKFTAQGGVTIEVSLERENAQNAVVRFRVIDTGIGIPANRLNRLFERFSQVDSSTSRKYGGTGLGLAISKRLVEMMGGQIGVVSQPGEGSEFWFTLVLPKPSGSSETVTATKDRAETGASQTPQLSLEERGKLRILLTEDNATNQMVALSILKKAGYMADVAANGQEALAALELVPYDLVLMDVQMPEMDGLEATRTIRHSEACQACANVPIIAMTAHAMKGDREQCLEAGMDDYVTKPVRPEELLAAIERQARGRVTASPALPPQAPIAPGVFIREEALERLGGDAVFLDNVIRVFMGDAPGLFKGLSEALKTQDAKTAQRLAHSIKGTAGTISANNLQAAAAQVEFAARDQDVPQATTLLGPMWREFELLRAELDTEKD